MRKLILTLVIIQIFVLSLLAQQNPFYIKNLSVWCISTEENGSLKYIDRVSNENIADLKESTLSKLNFNPALNLRNTSNPLILELDSIDYAKATFFSVYAPKNEQGDEVVWDLTKNNESYLILTNQRMADLEDVRYMNFIDQNHSIPTINTYLQHKNKSKIPIETQSLILGHTVSENLPTTPFNGTLAELMIFNRTLSPDERASIETYLSIKYGIPLSKETIHNYTSSSRLELWDKTDNLPFANQIIGIGRDDALDLYQKQSTYSREAGAFIIGINQLENSNEENEGLIQDNNFLLVGNNQLDLAFAKKEIGQPQHLYRKWMVEVTGSTIQNTSSFVQINTNPFEDNPLKRGEIFWLTVDRSATGTFPLGMVDYYPMKSYKDDLIYFDQLYWDIDKSSKDVFALSIGKAMMATLWIDQPNCSLEKAGRIHINLQGGKAPYTLQLSSKDNAFSQSWINSSGTLEQIDNLSQGEYTLIVEDASANIFRESFYVQSEDAIQSDLKEQYFLQSENFLTLDASKDMPSNVWYEWILPNGNSLDHPVLNTNEEGIYTLYIHHEGCISKKQIEILNFQQDNFEQIKVFPNPILTENPFDVIVKLHRSADVLVNIYDALGRSVKQQRLSGNDFYRFNEKIKNKGTYLISFTSENNTQTIKIVVE